MTRRRIAIGATSLAGVIILALIAAVVFTYWSVNRPYPDYDGTVDMPGLTGDVTVLRDQQGIAHIYADDAMDLFRAQGYVHAQDRFWEMDLRRHVTAGRLSELFGEDQLETDAFVRTLGWRRVAEEELPLLAPETRRYLNAYADGVNTWLDGRSGGELGLAYTVLGLTSGDETPEPWTPVDSLSWLKAMAWDLSENVRFEVDRALLSEVLPDERVAQLYPGATSEISPPIVSDVDVPPTTGTVVDDEGEPVPASAAASLSSVASVLAKMPPLLGRGEGRGSNSWVVDGSLTDTGEPMLANDPHLGPALPSVWYQVGLHCREKSKSCPFDVAGFSFSGVPGVIIGHNDRVAWGFTNLGADVADLYLEDVRRTSYRVGDNWMPLDTRTELIEVAGAADVSITVRSTRNGPLISDHDTQMREVGQTASVEGRPAEDTYDVALRWTALDPGTTADAIFAFNRAENWADFRAAAALFEVPSQNLLYADVDGNIGYQAPGKIPVRSSGDGTRPVPGWMDEYQWAGYVPSEELPFVLNPDAGYIVTANQPVTGSAYEYLLTSDFQQGYRSGRIDDVLSGWVAEGRTVTADDMVDLQMDTHSAAAEILVPYLNDLSAPDGYYGDGLRLLREWDRTLEADSAAAAYFNAVWRRTLSGTFHDELPEETWPDGGGRWYTVLDRLLEDPTDRFWDNVTTFGVETRDDILSQAVRDARDDMTRRQGKDPANWSWGRLHVLEQREQTFGSSGIAPIEWLFNRGSVEVGGGPAVVLANGWDATEGFETVWVPSMRMVVDLADFDESRWIDLTGVSGHPGHEHYGDQTELWRDRETLPMRWSSGDIRDNAEHTLTIVPRSDP